MHSVIRNSTQGPQVGWVRLNDGRDVEVVGWALGSDQLDEQLEYRAGLPEAGVGSERVRRHSHHRD